MGDRIRDGGQGNGDYQDLVQRWLNPLFQHVQLVYPLADTAGTVSHVFATVRDTDRPPDAPTERAWLYRLAHTTVYPDDTTIPVVRRRNNEAVMFSLVDVVTNLTGATLLTATRAVEALEALSPEHREVVRFLTVEELHPNELGWILDIDPDDAADLITTAKQHLSNAAESPDTDPRPQRKPRP